MKEEVTSEKSHKLLAKQIELGKAGLRRKKSQSWERQEKREELPKLWN